MKNFRCFVVAVVLFQAAPALASDLTIFGGLQKPGTLTLQTLPQNVLSVPVNPKDFGVFGVRVTSGSVIGFENTLAYSPNFIRSENNAFIYTGNLIAQVPLVYVRPYATAGLGVMYIGGTAFEAVTGGKFAVNYGGGLKIFPGGPVGARLDVRGYTVPSIQDETLNILEVSLGVVFSW